MNTDDIIMMLNGTYEYLVIIYMLILLIMHEFKQNFKINKVGMINAVLMI